MGISNGGYLIPSVIKVPRNRLQVFKARWFPRWLYWLWPVKYEKIDAKEAILKEIVNVSNDR